MPDLLLCLDVGRCPCPDFTVIDVTGTLVKSNRGKKGLFHLTIPNYSPSAWRNQDRNSGATNVASPVVSQENKCMLACSQLDFSSLLLFKTAACACPCVFVVSTAKALTFPRN